MEESSDASISVEVVQQKVGRNLLLFQKLEYTLKMMVAMADLSGYASDFENIKERRKAWAMGKTLGQIVGEHFESFNPADEEKPEPSPRRMEPYFSVRHTTQCDEASLDKRKSVLAGFVKERNELVHHLLATYRLNEEESRRQLAVMLDGQHQRLQEEVDLSFSLGKARFESHREVAAWLQSEEGRKFMANELEAEEKHDQRT
jgi:hypothetical protein